ncbi:CocE/NonD family hydrolase [Sphingobium sp. SA916]|uniref:CocE/NonD family hydrolase n=1 Tax=Sphingobium sp. SA916 TaxID=1851207 RepID=UPI000C9F35C6|nr:CocE/NonD family hydrolase [Sphingobium sp. SA916]
MTQDNAATAACMIVQENVMVPMRDGVHLATDISLPSDDGVAPAPGRFPALVVRTPYSRVFLADFPPDMIAGATVINRPLATARGYAVVFQDVRGAHGSEGRLQPMQNETADGADTVAWISEQPWSDGRVAFCGPSYSGLASMMGTVAAPPALSTSYVQAPATEVFNNGWFLFEGVYMQHYATQWPLMQSLDPACHSDPELAAAARRDFLELHPDENMTWMTANFPDDFFDRLFRIMPLKDMPVVRHMPFWREMIENRDNPAFFDANAMKDKLSNVDVPVLHVNGWYDGFIRNTYEHYEGLVARAATQEARDGQRLFIGPWSHGACFECPPGGAVDGQQLMLTWMDQCFKGIRSPVFDAPVTIYVMGENRWRTETSWPLPGTERTRFYLHSQGGANTASGDGALSMEQPGRDERPDQYRYDPVDPVRNIGGVTLYGGRMAQNEMEARPDMLCYTSAELEEDLEVTGKVRATLFAGSSAQDTDWWIRLIDVRPDGRADALCHGVARARYRNSRTNPEPLIPGEICEYAIGMQATSNVFKKGHRIRVEVTSSCFPLGERNPNAFVDLNSATEDDFVVAAQTIYHDAKHPSYVELPIIPAGRERNWIDTPFPLASGKHFEFPA